jgi:type II secretory pathway component PulM
VVTSYADRNQVPYTRVTQTPSGDVQIDLGDTSHRAVFSWLRSLEESEGVVVTAAYLAPGEGAGTVSGRFTMQRAAR